MDTRRTFLKKTAFVGASIAVPWTLGIPKAMAAPKGSPNVPKFVDPLLAQIPILTPLPNSPVPGADYYEIVMSAGEHKFHSRFAGKARTLRYGAMPYLGPTIEAQAGKPVVVKFINHLPITDAGHPLGTSIDPTIPDPEMYKSPDGSPLPAGRAVPHLHGGFTMPDFDGHPHSWFTPLGQRGSHYASLQDVAGDEAMVLYSNAQPAANLWYHDHAMGITRLNVYAGLAALYFVRDEFDTGRAGTGLNLPAGPYEVPLVIQDKQFNQDGSLFYPRVGITPAHPVWVPEFFGDTPVVNAVAYPYLDVEPRRYRFRIVNGSQARFYDLKLTGPKGHLPFSIIGMEQSLLPAPVLLNNLLLAPAERADVIVDFAGLPPGGTITLSNEARAPFPGGRRGELPHIMQFRVNLPLAGPDLSTPPSQLVLPAVARLVPTPDAPIREIVMKEDADPDVGAPTDVKLNGKWFDEPADELPQVNTTEVWQFINLTEDAHPMHVHLVRFQIVDRQPFDSEAYDAAHDAWVAAGQNPSAKPVLSDYVTAPPVQPAPEESGWKDTAKSYPGEILRVIAKFEVPEGTSLPAEYVYHCHILEHEENEMMRPFIVMP
jgi:spore coat protein A